jgi:polysaccharide chain length determinant protein (PEP-CTERM system associated)
MLPGKQYTPLEIAGMAWRHRWLIAMSLVLGVYGGLIVSSRLKDMYQSEMLIQVVPQRVPDSYVRSTVTMRTEERLNALSKQVMSRTELERLIEQMDLYPEERNEKEMQDVVLMMRAKIELEPVRSQRDTRETDAFYIRFAYPDRTIATKVTKALGDLFINVNAQDRGDLARVTREFLQTQLSEARQRLEATERRLEQFRERNAGRLPTQLDSNMQAIRGTQMELQAVVESLARDRDRKLMLERLYADAQTEVAPAQPAPPPVQVPAGAPPDSVVPSGTAQQQLKAAKEQLARLELRLKPEHPDILRLKRLIRDLEARVADDADKAAKAPASEPAPLTQEQITRRDRIQQMRAEIESLQRQLEFKEAEEQRVRKTIADYQRRIEQVPGVESEWIALTRDYDTQQTAYKDLLAKSEQSKVAAELEKGEIGEQFRVLDPARPPVRPVGLVRLQVNGIGAFAGLALGILLAALLEVLDTTFHSAQDIMDVLKVPVIARVPYLPNDSDRQQQQRSRVFASAAASLTVILGGYGFWAMQLWKFIK